MQRWLRCILMLVMVATASAQPPLLQELISAARGASEPEKITKIQEDDPRAVECARQAVEEDNARVAPTMVTNFTTVLLAYSTPGRVVVPEEKKVNIPLFGEAEMMVPHMEKGNTFFMMFLASERLKSPMQRALNTWPQYQVHCGTVFDSNKEGETPIIEQHMIPEERVLEPTDPGTKRTLALLAVGHLRKSTGKELDLAVVTGYELQQAGLTLVEPGTAIPARDHSLQLTGQEKPPPGSSHTVVVEYISFLTSDGQPHMAAVATVENGTPKVVSYVSGGGVDNTKLVVVKLLAIASSSKVEQVVHLALFDMIGKYKDSALSIQVHPCEQQSNCYFAAVLATAESTRGEQVTKAVRQAIRSPQFSTKLATLLGAGSNLKVQVPWLGSANGPPSLAVVNRAPVKPHAKQATKVPMVSHNSHDHKSHNEAIMPMSTEEMPWYEHTWWAGWLVSAGLTVALVWVLKDGRNSQESKSTALLRLESERRGLLDDT